MTTCLLTFLSGVAGIVASFGLFFLYNYLNDILKFNFKAEDFLIPAAISGILLAVSLHTSTPKLIAVKDCNSGKIVACNY